MSTHTKGPWRLGLDGDVAYIFSADHKRPVTRLGLTDLRPGVTEENIANARLIAASPDLYEAARELTAYFYPNGEWKGYAWFDDRIVALAFALRQALAKAEGKG